ncbi:hypothetical protein J6590_003192 [Homalodisca vitripennis]|nr:hypothetical protein J6590_003192 [Homalodisca vitripennis]
MNEIRPSWSIYNSPPEDSNPYQRNEVVYVDREGVSPPVALLSPTFLRGRDSGPGEDVNSPVANFDW